MSELIKSVIKSDNAETIRQLEEENSLLRARNQEWSGLIDYLREWLRQGASIKATDPDSEILEMLPDGSINGNLTITPARFIHKVKMPNLSSDENQAVS